MNPHRCVSFVSYAVFTTFNICKHRSCCLVCIPLKTKEASQITAACYCTPSPATCYLLSMFYTSAEQFMKVQYSSHIIKQRVIAVSFYQRHVLRVQDCELTPRLKTKRTFSAKLENIRLQCQIDFQRRLDVGFWLLNTTL